MADADDFDVESLRRLLRGESGPAPAASQKARPEAAAPRKAARKPTATSAPAKEKGGRKPAAKKRAGR